MSQPTTHAPEPELYAEVGHEVREGVSSRQSEPTREHQQGRQGRVGQRPFRTSQFNARVLHGRGDAFLL